MRKLYQLAEGNTSGRPMDLVALMRAIRAGKVDKKTLLISEEMDAPLPAGKIEEVARLFESEQYKPYETSDYRFVNADRALGSGWQFIMESSIMTAYAGGMLILAFLLSLGLTGQMGVYAGGLVSWLIFCVLHSICFIFTARVYRGQTMGQDFMNLQLSPIISSLVFFSILYALIVAAGFALLVIPGIIFGVFLLFTPIIMMDRQLPLGKSIGKSIHLIRRAGVKQFVTIAILLILHFVCIFLIIPAPLTAPLLMAALCEIYEKNSV